MVRNSLTPERAPLISTLPPDCESIHGVQRNYGTLESLKADPKTTVEHDVLRPKYVDEVRVEVTEIRNPPGSRRFKHKSLTFWLIFACICWNEFMANFDATLMASSHPVITSEFHSSDAASWLSTSFLITSTAFMPMFAPLSDTIGRRPLVLATSILLAIATAWCAIAPNVGSFIAARALCGIGAGGTAALGAVLVNDFVPIEARASYQSILNLAYGLGQAGGVAMGGFLCDTIGWRWAFGSQVPWTVFCAGIFTLTIPGDLGPQLARNSNDALRTFLKAFDLAGVFLLATSVTCLILYLNLGGSVLGWSDPVMTTVLILCCITAFLFLRVESKAKHPVLPLELLRKWPRANINFASFCTSLIFSAVIFNIPLYFEVVKHDSPTTAGFRLILPFLALTATAFLCCIIIRQKSTIRPVMVFGSFFVLVGTAILPFMGRKTSNWASLLYLVPLSTGYGVMSPAGIICLLRTSPESEHAVSIGAFLLWKKLASVVGIAVSTLMVQNLLAHFLHKNVTGANREQIIHKVRKSVHSIRYMTPVHQEEIVSSYYTSLRITFASMVIFAVILVIIVIPIKLPEDDVSDEE